MDNDDDAQNSHVTADRVDNAITGNGSCSTLLLVIGSNRVNEQTSLQSRSCTGEQTKMSKTVSYTHLTLPTKRIV